MPPDFTFIVNPNAALGKGVAVGRKLKAALDHRNLRYDMLLTDSPGAATGLARSATANVVVSVGGDGTLNEVLNGIIGTGKVLGIIPAGSGNDFIKSVGIPADPMAALESLLAGSRLTIDVGSIFAGPPQLSSRRFFCNGVGIGFDAEVAARTSEVRRFRGIGVYLVAVLKTLGSYNAPEFSLRVDETRLDGRKLLIAIGNGTCAGGGFYLTPRASAIDGVLDVCAIDSMGTLSILRLMPKVMRGRHLTLGAVRYLQGRTVEVKGDRPFSVHADGEMIGRGIERIRIEVMAGAVEIAGAGILPQEGFG